MCLIIASPTGKRISDKILEEAAQSNGHGAGIAWMVKERIQFRKGLEVDEVKKLLDDEIKGQPWAVHFRIATHGPVCEELTHPFSIDERASIDNAGEADAVLFQNGTFSQWKEYLMQAAASSGTPVPPPPWSDSRAVAFLCHVYGKHVLSILDNHSRFLVFDAKDKKERRMLLWGTWHDYDVFKFSNTGTSAFRTSYTPSAGGGSENPTSAIDVDAEAVEASGGTSSSNPPMTPSTNGSTNSSNGKTTSAVTSKRTAPFRMKPTYNPWTAFDKTGVFVKADNEAGSVSQ